MNDTLQDMERSNKHQMRGMGQNVHPVKIFSHCVCYVL